MARLPRFDLPGYPQHVIQRGNNREAIFCATEDYRFYLDKLSTACKKHDCVVHAYVLMTNHVHLLVTPHRSGVLGKVIQMLGRYYVQYFNYTYKRTGTLWEGRYTEPYLLTCYRYIELNPVRAAMVAHPRDYSWPSYHHNAQDKGDPLVIPHAMYNEFGSGPVSRQAAYRALFKHHMGEHTLNTVREATNKAWVLGNDRFRDKIQKQLER